MPVGVAAREGEAPVLAEAVEAVLGVVDEVRFSSFALPKVSLISNMVSQRQRRSVSVVPAPDAKGGVSAARGTRSSPSRPFTAAQSSRWLL